MSETHFCNDIDNFPANKFFQQGSGDGSAILILGESLSSNGWIKSGKAFYKSDGRTLIPSGKNLNKLLEKFGLKLESCGFTELVKCCVAQNRKLLNTCGAKWWPFFVKQLEKNNFKIIIILGIETLKIFNGLAGFNLMVGKVGRVTINDRDYMALPIYHPSPINPTNHPKNIRIFNDPDNNLGELLKRVQAAKELELGDVVDK